MKRFEKWRESDINEFRETSDHSMKGTPLGVRGEDFQEFMMDVDGFELWADAYVYVIVLERQDDGTHWYYVGETTDGIEGLKSRFEIHLKCEMSKPIERNGIEVLDGALPKNCNNLYVMIGVDRAEPVSVEQDHLLDARASERERRMAYEVAIEKNTTNVIGGA